MTGKALDVSHEETHLGLVRTPDGKVNATVSQNITKARRAVYAMMGSGLHGLNGLHPKASTKLWNIYILPRLTYGLESLQLTAGNIEELERFQRKTMRRIQHLPDGTSNVAVLMLLGILPVQAIVERRALVFFVSLIEDPTSIEAKIVHRQLAVKDCTSHSWLIYLKKCFTKYDLPSPHSLLLNPPEKRTWKKIVKDQVSRFWLEQMLQEAGTKATLLNVNLSLTVPGRLHHVWETTPLAPMDILRANVKVKILVGRYYLQADQARFKGLNPTCTLCSEADEDLQHFVITCPVLRDIRIGYWSSFKLYVDGMPDKGPDGTDWEALIRDPKRLVKFILDPTLVFPNLNSALLTQIESETRRYLFALHSRRVVLLGRGMIRQVVPGDHASSGSPT